MSVRYIVGDVRDVLATIPDASVDLILTSPPFLALRSYLPADHPDKHREIGSEATPGAFIDTLLDLTEEWARVLTPHGSLCVELGDTYSGSGGAGGDYNEDGWREGQPRFRAGYDRRDGRKTMQREDYRAPLPVPAKGGLSTAPRECTPSGDQTPPALGWPLTKSLCMIPQSYAWALAYGRNPFTGRTTEPWRVRNIVRWCRPNPPVGALGDKFRPATSEMVVACKSAKRWFDLDAVRGPASENTHARTAQGVESRPNTGKSADDARRGGNFSSLDVLHETAGAPPLDWWNIPTQPYKGAHYATWPEELCRRPILAMCPQRVCRTCGEPSRRIVDELTPRIVSESDAGKDRAQGRSGGPFVKAHTVTPAIRIADAWTDCGHDDWRPGICLDPFAGSGTTLAVAQGHGRHAIGIDFDARNAELAVERVGPLYLTVEYAAADEVGTK